MISHKASEIKKWMTEELIHRPNKLFTSYLFEGKGFYNSIGNSRANSSNNIVGVSLSLKRTNDFVINVLSVAPLNDKAYLSKYFKIPKDDINTRTIGKISIQRRYRPLLPGTSMAHYQVTAGTFGCVVKDYFRNYYLLSNNHVFTNCNRANIDDLILQPGYYDGGTIPGDEAATLHDFHPLDTTGINEIDAAIAWPTQDFYTQIPNIGKITGTKSPLIGMKVKKFGRTTGYTVGKIISRSADIKVNFGTQVMQFSDQFEIQGINKRFSNGGDSGSLIVEYDTNKAVGLLFAGNTSGTTFANPITKVLERFDVTIA